jgi:hypothetical protein
MIFNCLPAPTPGKKKFKKVQVFLFKEGFHLV